MVSLRCVGVGECQSEDSFVCFAAKPAQRACTRDFLRDRKKTRKGKVPEQNRKELATVRERRRSERGSFWRRSWDLWTQRPGQPAWEDESAFLVAVWEFFSNTRSWHPPKHRMPERCQNFSLLTLRPNPSPCLFVLLSSTLGYICYICYIFVKHVKCPWPEMRESTRLSNSHELI